MSPHNPGILRCVQALLAGEVIACPTEGVWGLSCDPYNDNALAKVIQLKRRAPQKGLILVAATMRQLDFLLWDIGAEQRRQLAASWPGHTTWLLPHRQRVPSLVHGCHDTVAVRVSAHPVVRLICEKSGGAMVSTSANPQGRPPAKSRLAVYRYFAREQAVTLAPGRVGDAGRPSAIRDLRTGVVYR